MGFLDNEGALVFLGRGAPVDFSRVIENIRELDRNFERRKQIINRGRQIMDGDGLERIKQLVMDMLRS